MNGLAGKRYPPSEEDVLEAFRQWLNTERHANYQISERPDKEKSNQNHPDIDFILNDPKSPPRIAVEVSSVWRSKEAGKEDAYFDKWFERVRARVYGRIAGTFYVFLPMDVPATNPDEFAVDLVNVIQREGVALTGVKKGKHLIVQGVSVKLYKAKLEGNDINYARYSPDVSEFPSRVKIMLNQKAPKLLRYKDEGLETWIVAYNTAWPLFSPVEVQQTVRSLLGADHAHVDHVGICSGDASVIVAS